VILKVSLRSVLRHRRRTILTVLTMMAGFVLSAVAISWAEGTYDGIISLFTNSMTGQIQIHAAGYLDDPSIYDTVDDYTSVGEALDSTDGVRTWAPRTYTGALVSLIPSGSGGIARNSAGSMITGIDPVREEEATSFSGQIASGAMLTPGGDSLGILLGSGLAVILEAGIGDTVVVFSQAADGSAADARFTVRGFVDTGNDYSDRTGSWIALRTAQDLFVLRGRVHEIAVMTASLSHLRELSSEISGRLGRPDLDVQPWMVFQETFYKSMKADMDSMWVMIVVIVIVTAMGVFNTVLMSVLERRREFGVLNALGTRPGFIVRMVVTEAMVMAAASIVAGTLISLVVIGILSKHGLVLNEPVTYGGMAYDRMSALLTPICLWIPAAAVALTSFAVSLIPAVKASRTRPARALRTV
jgi:ABC-type lipoprotein release transport system permease subunit